MAGNFKDMKDDGYTQETISRMKEMRIRHMQELATRSTKGKLVIAHNSCHAIPIDQPEIIIESVRDIVTYHGF